VSYRAVLFDLFDTLVWFDRNRLPEVRVNGKVIRSTAGHLHEAFRPFAPGVELAPFVDALLWSWQEAERLRHETHREVAAPERLSFLVSRLGLEAAILPPEAMAALLATHMRELSKAVVFPPHHAPLLSQLRTAHRLAVVSNFDYTPTARGILEREGIAALFETVVVSDEIGWRKPKAVIFETALRRLGIGAGEALFVGDRADIDILGAQGVGMDVAWINRDSAALPAGIPPPTFEIRDLHELLRVLGIRGAATGIQ
jgi:HAD superfamily hydrolase (TIGR01549 family)